MISTKRDGPTRGSGRPNLRVIRSAGLEVRATRQHEGGQRSNGDCEPLEELHSLAPFGRSVECAGLMAPVGPRLGDTGEVSGDPQPGDKVLLRTTPYGVLAHIRVSG